MGTMYVWHTWMFPRSTSRTVTRLFCFTALGGDKDGPDFPQLAKHARPVMVTLAARRPHRSSKRRSESRWTSAGQPYCPEAAPKTGPGKSIGHQLAGA